MPKGTCSIEECDKGTYCRGWCRMHYHRWLRHGDPLWEKNAHGTREQRFWPKVNKDGPVPEHRPELGPCWIWTAALTRRGYGAFAKGGKKGGMMPAHRFAYELLVGPIPQGLELDHLCRITACVNPSHLEPVTHAENVSRGEASAWRRAMTHCSHGHPFDDANTRLDRGGRRVCRTCERERKRGR